MNAENSCAAGKDGASPAVPKRDLLLPVLCRVRCLLRIFERDEALELVRSVRRQDHDVASSHALLLLEQLIENFDYHGAITVIDALND